VEWEGLAVLFCGLMKLDGMANVKKMQVEEPAG